MRKILDFYKEYWAPLVTLKAVLFFVVSLTHNYIIMPHFVQPALDSLATNSVAIDEHIINTSYKLFVDSNEVWADRMIMMAPGGFGSKISDCSDYTKDAAADTLCAMMNSYSGDKMRFGYLMSTTKYLFNFSHTLLMLITKRVVIDGIEFRQYMPDVNEPDKYVLYYQAGDGKWWKAIHFLGEGYYCIDNRGDRIKCMRK